MSKFTARKYAGDDSLSWAVFRKEAVKGLGRGPIMPGDASPLFAGLSKSEAEHFKRLLEKRAAELLTV